MKSILVSIVAALLVVGCGEAQQSAPPAEAKPVEPVAEVSAQPSSPQVEAELTEPVAEATRPKPPTAKTPDESLWEATLFGEIEPAKQAIADGADVNAKDEDTGDTPLHRAVVAALDSGRNEVVELLIANGADVNATGGTFGGTPLDITKRLSEAATLTKRLRELQGKTDDIPVADLLRKHGGKTGAELKAEGK